MGGEQVAFDAVGEEAQRALAFLARRDALALLGQPLRNPVRQRGALDRVHLEATPPPSRARNQAPQRVGVEPGQEHEGQRGVIARRGGGELLEGRAAFLARLAGGDADLEELLVGEEAQRTAGGKNGAPVEVRAGDGVHRALGVAFRPRAGPDRIGRFLHEQGLVAVQGVQRTAGPLEMGAPVACRRRDADMAGSDAT